MFKADFRKLLLPLRYRLDDKLDHTPTWKVEDNFVRAREQEVQGHVELEEVDFNRGILGLPSPVEIADHPNCYRFVPKSTRALWIQVCKSILRSYQRAAVFENTEGVIAAVISLLRLPAKVLEVRRDLRWRQRNIVIERALQSMLNGNAVVQGGDAGMVEGGRQDEAK